MYEAQYIRATLNKDEKTKTAIERLNNSDHIYHNHSDRVADELRAIFDTDYKGYAPRD